jgi:hypothetical protein
MGYNTDNTDTSEREYRIVEEGNVEWVEGFRQKA